MKKGRLFIFIFLFLLLIFSSLTLSEENTNLSFKTFKECGEERIRPRFFELNNTLSDKNIRNDIHICLKQYLKCKYSKILDNINYIFGKTKIMIILDVCGS